MGRKGVAQRVRGYASVDSGRKSIAPDELPERLARERPARSRHKQVRTGSALQEPLPHSVQVIRQFAAGKLPEWYRADFRAFAFHNQIIAVEIDLLVAERHQFGHPDSGSVEKLEHGLIAPPEITRWIRLRQKTLNVLGGKCFGQLARGRPQMQLGQRLSAANPFGGKKLI